MSGSYKGVPDSHLMDELSDALGILDESDIQIKTNASGVRARATLGVSISYPLRGGVLIIIAKDCGEGSSVIPERGHTCAMKSQISRYAARQKVAIWRREFGLQRIRKVRREETENVNFLVGFASLRQRRNIESLNDVRR
jgi:TPP-dependent indolepyruvate ferredoxin oxidoreductase alpha subunit